MPSRNLADGLSYFAQAASGLELASTRSARWDALSVQVMQLAPGGWTHPGADAIRLTVALSDPARVRRRLGGERSTDDATMRWGRFCVTPCGADGNWSWDEASHFAILFLPANAFRQSAIEAGARSKDYGLAPVFAAEDATVAEIVRRLADEIGTEGRQSRLLASAAANFLTTHLLCRYAGLVPIPPTALQGRRLARVVDAIEARLSYDWTIEELAAEAGIGPVWFAHSFKAATGASPRNYLRRRRLHRARRLLTETDRSIVEVALACGFGTQSWFTTAFRREFGIPPASYRRQIT